MLTSKLFFFKPVSIALLLCFTFILGCKNQPSKEVEPVPSMLNLNHLDNLGEVVTYNGQKIRLIHIYAEAPDYNWVGDSDEGISCVDDVARAAVVYLRHFELTGNEESSKKAKQLLRFILYMQNEDGLFNNFVFSNQLDKNTTHQNSVADEMNWWAARAIWALGTGARVLAEKDTAFSQMCLTAIDKTMPHIQKAVSSYPESRIINNYRMPTWLVSASASDASSELLLGLASVQKVAPNAANQNVIDKLAEGISMMQYGSVSEAPYGAHLSWKDGWHGWGNSQTMALIDAGKPESAIKEGDNFYPWLLVNGWIHSFKLSNPQQPRYFEQIAYATRGVAVGLIRLYEETQNEDYAIMAGLAASWFTGNNVAGKKMYNPLYGYGYDGINNATTINKNSGAESTIEADMAILEIEQHPLAKKWMYSTSQNPDNIQVNGKKYRYKIFEVAKGKEIEKKVLILNLSDSTYELLNEAGFNKLIHK
jgi:hypothetical protein